MKNKENDSYIREIEAIITSLGLKVIREQKTGFSITPSQIPVKTNNKNKITIEQLKSPIVEKAYDKALLNGLKKNAKV